MWSAHVPRQRKSEKVLKGVCEGGRGEREQEEREKNKRERRHARSRRRERRGRGGGDRHTFGVRNIHSKQAIKCAQKPRARATNSSNCSLYHAAVQHTACWWGRGAARAATRVLVSACRLVLRAGEGGRLKMGLHDEKHSSHVCLHVSNWNSPCEISKTRKTSK
jgi:hypothetical protein